MKKRIVIAVLVVLAVFLVLAGIKALQIRAMIANGKKQVPPIETVTATTVTSQSWETALGSFGTLSAVQGVSVAAEVAGKVTKIAFESGSAVRKGDLLLQQDTSTEEAQLPGALSQTALSRANQQRADRMFAEGIISRADYDLAVANSAQAQAQVDTIRAAIAKKTLRAPFSGRLGIRQVNLGQMLREGDQVVTLQALDPIFVEFSIPQQQLSLVRIGLPVRLSGDALGAEVMTGRVTAITPLVDAETRNVRIQATVANKGERLRPGMSVNASIGLPQKQNVLVIPATAVLNAPYSDSVFVIEEKKAGNDSKGGLVLRQQFVRLGERRGDFAAVTSGLKAGENIVSTGVFKLRNGQAVTIDNQLAPEFKLAPKPENN